MEKKKSDLSMKKNYSGSILERYLDSVHYCDPDTVPDDATRWVQLWTSGPFFQKPTLKSEYG